MILNTKQISDFFKLKHKDFFEDFVKVNGRKAILGIVLVGENKVSNSYIRIKSKYAEAVDVEVKQYLVADIESQEMLENIVSKASKECEGVIVQLPILKNFNLQKVLENIDIQKDIDLLRSEKSISTFVQPVVFSIREIIKHFDIQLHNKNIVVLGQGALVGLPVSAYLNSQNIEHIKLDKNSSHSYTQQALQNADVLITGVGQANVIGKEMLKPGVVIIDAGTSEDGDTVVGDVNKDCAEIASLFVTTPGGAGPLTVCGLFENLKIAIENKYE